MKETSLPQDLLVGTGARKLILQEIDSVECLLLLPQTTIALHGHDDNQWEVWIWANKVYICSVGEIHTLVNKSNEVLRVMAIKGHGLYTYEDLEQFFSGLGYEVKPSGIISFQQIN